MRIVVAGATGTVGKHVVTAAHRHGHHVVALSRRDGIDVQTGENLDAALEDADAVIDTLNLTTLSTKKAVDYFETVTGNLLRAEARQGVRHHVALSIVGIDEIDTSYYAGKLAQERIVAESDIPHTIARTGQFHEFAEQVVTQASVGALTLVPRTLSRPVAAREVGEHLVAIAEADPAGRATDLVGPRDESLAEMVRRMFRHDGLSRKVIELRLPGLYGRGLASGDLRGGGNMIVAETTFDDWLTSEHRG
jgi:uncharacterized protein YbjT (DUF2867 family)